MTIILVTGLMRSGTSLVAKQLHELGVPMGTAMRFPLMRENSQLDFEDIEFTDNCLAALQGKISTEQLKRFFSTYIWKRGRHKITWGVKSPFLLPYVDLFKQMAKEPTKVILTIRPVEDTYRSIEEQTRLAGPKEIQDILVKTETINSDLTIDIKESWNWPGRVRYKLAELIKE